MPQVVKSTLLLYADDSLILYQHKEVDEIEKHLNKNFENICHWFVDNRLSIHFGEDKTKSILFASKRRSLEREPIALKVINKINGKLKFLCRKNRYLTKELRRMLCNALIQPHFGYAYPAWYPNLNKKTKKKIQIMQNFCLKLDKMHSISDEEFKSINWLPASKRFDQCINIITYNFINNTYPYYLNEILKFALHCSIGKIITFLTLKIFFAKQTSDNKLFIILLPLFGTAFLTLLKERIV